jgi:hypothetical protein
MTYTEEYQGFVPVSIHIQGQRIDGRVWKFAKRRLLQQIEEDRRQFVPLVDAKLYELQGKSERLVSQFDVLAVSKRAIRAIEPGDTVTQVSSP